MGKLIQKKCPQEINVRVKERERRVEIMTEIRKSCLFDKAIEKSTVLRLALNSSHKPPN